MKNLPKSFKKLTPQQKGCLWSEIRAEYDIMRDEVARCYIGGIRDKMRAIEGRLKKLERAAVVDALENS